MTVFANTCVRHSAIGYVTIVSSHNLETQRTRMCCTTQNSERILRRLQIATFIYNRDLSSIIYNILRIMKENIVLFRCGGTLIEFVACLLMKINTFDICLL